MHSYFYDSPLLKSVITSPGRTAVVIVAFFSLLHLFVMGHADLTNDEAQYALYGYYLDWSYFDHPPLSGWINALVLKFSDSEFALRLWPLLLSILTSYLLYGFSRELFPAASQWLGTLTVLVYQSSMITQVIALAMLPDTPLIPLAVGAYWTLLRAIKNNSARDWILTGILFGLAGLAKYTAVTLVITAIAALFIYRRSRIIFSPWPWLAVIIAGILIIPVIYWNMQHDWISINYQLNHGAPDTAWQFGNFLISQLSQLISYSPAIYIFGFLAIIFVLRNRKDQNQLYILAMALPGLVLFNWNSGYAQALPHWTAVAWISLSPLIAYWLIQNWQSKAIRISSYLNLGYSILLTLLIHVALGTNLIPYKENKHPLEDIHGWKQASMQARQHLQTMKQQEPEKNPVILVGNWSQFARLAWYAKPDPVQVTDTRYGQSDIWYGSIEKGTNGVLVVPPIFLNDAGNGIAKFEKCLLIENFEYKLDNKVAATYPFYRCYNYQG